VPIFISKERFDKKRGIDMIFISSSKGGNYE